MWKSQNFKPKKKFRFEFYFVDRMVWIGKKLSEIKKLNKWKPNENESNPTSIELRTLVKQFFFSILEI